MKNYDDRKSTNHFCPNYFNRLVRINQVKEVNLTNKAKVGNIFHSPSLAPSPSPLILLDS